MLAKCINNKSDNDRWFGLRLDALGALLVLILFILIVALRIGSPSTLVGGFAGV